MLFNHVMGGDEGWSYALPQKMDREQALAFLFLLHRTPDSLTSFADR